MKMACSSQYEQAISYLIYISIFVLQFIFMIQRIFLYIVFFCISFLFIACGGSNSTNNGESNQEYQETGYPVVDGLTKKIFDDPSNHDLLYQRSKAYMEIEAFDNAISDMYMAMKIDSLQPKYYTHLADIFMQYYRSAQALETLRIGAEKFPSNRTLLLNYAELCITLRQNQKGIQVIQQILELDPENAQAYFLMGILMSEQGDTNRAKGAFRRVVDIDPEVVDAYLLLGELHEEDDPKLALQYFNNAITVDPENINALHSKAFFLQNNDRIPEALELYEQINTLAPDYVPAFLNAGILFLETENFERAYEQFNIIVGAEPTSHLGYYYRGLAQKGLGNLELAKSDFQQALNLKSDYQKAQDELSLMK